MRIACPACSAAYDVPDDRLALGRDVRCARCSTVWSPVPAASSPSLALLPPALQPPLIDIEDGFDDAPPTPAYPAPPADETLLPVPVAEPGPSRRERLAALVAWLLTAVFVAVLTWLAVARRAEIMHAWPPSERAYVLLGLTH